MELSFPLHALENWSVYHFKLYPCLCSFLFAILSFYLKVIPLYGRGGDHTQDPRNKIPPRPSGRRVEPEPAPVGFGGVFNNLFGTPDGGSNFRMSIGIGAFPFGFLATAFNVGGGSSGNGTGGVGGDSFSGQNGPSLDGTWNADAETMSKLCLFMAIFFIVWLLIA